jgi:NCS1 family nucleobase:cation symporter-1
VPALAKLSWRALLAISIAPVAAVGLLIPELFFAHFGAFLAFIGVGFAPLCGMQIADYYLLRRRRIDVRGLFASGPGAAYRYWAGFNPAAISGMIAGCATYLYLLNPTTYASRAPYEYLTASLPTALVGALVYSVVTLLVVKPAGKGDYR